MLLLLVLLLFAQDPVLDGAARTAQAYMETLPNFICRQTTTRHLQPPHRAKRELIDVISAEVSVVGGVEDYRWILRNGTPIDGDGDLWRSGLWTRGEWTSVLNNSLHPSARASYKLLGPARASAFRGYEYEFSVEQPNSRWKVSAPLRSVFPPYRGKIFIEETSRRAVHVEMTADEFPSDFPIRLASVSVDYGWVQILGRRYLLPVKAATANCERTQNWCYFNTIQFFGHRKFEAESRLVAEAEAPLKAAGDPLLRLVWPVAQREARKVNRRRYYRTTTAGESREIDTTWTPPAGERRLVEFAGTRDRPLKSKDNAPTAFTDYLSTLSAIFDPAANTEFSAGGVYQQEPSPVHIYFFSVPRGRSPWLVLRTGQTFHAACKGVLLVEARTARVHTLSLRTEDLAPPLSLRRAEKIFFFHLPGTPYHLGLAPALAVDLEYPRDRATAYRMETRYVPYMRQTFFSP